MEQTNLRTNQQNRHIHWLFTRLGITDKDVVADIVYDFTDGKTCHTSELGFIEAMEFIKYLNSFNVNKRATKSERIDAMPKASPEWTKLDRKRKGVLRAIFEWSKLQGLQVTMDYVKKIACQAAETDRFNEISPDALTRIYYEFCGKQKVVTVKNREYKPICLN